MAPSFINKFNSICVVCALVDEAEQFNHAKSWARRLEICHPETEFRVIQTGLGAERINRALSSLSAGSYDALLVFGTAAGLNPCHRPGDVLLCTSVFDGLGRQQLLADPTFCSAISVKLKACGAKIATSYTSAEPLLTSKEKSNIFTKYSADCADMESSIVLRFAMTCQVPAAILRVVIDPSTQGIPESALNGMNQDGTTNALTTLGSLLKAPQELPSVLRLAIQYRLAMKSLNRAAKLLTTGL